MCQRREKQVNNIRKSHDKDATEDDLRKVFQKVGEINELRLMKNFQTGKNKGYAFVRYATAAEAKLAVNELANEKAC